MASDREAAGERIKAADAAAASAVEAVRGLGGEQDRIETAAELAAVLRDRSEEAARIRHDAALAIYDAEKLSLAKLASRVGISKARAEQIIKAREKGSGDAGADDGTG